MIYILHIKEPLFGKFYTHRYSFFFFFHSRTMDLDIIKVFYLPSDAQEKCFKKNIKIYLKTALLCFNAIAIRELLI